MSEMAETQGGILPRPVISIVTPCFNEVDNIGAMVDRVRDVMVSLPYDYEHIIIDNCSTDGSQDLLRGIAARDHRVRVILNFANYGHLRSPYHALMQITGVAGIILAADLQDPPELIPELVNKWREGAKVVLLVRSSTEERYWKAVLRNIYYRISSRWADSPQVHNAHGSGLMDREVVEYLRNLRDPYPYLRGLVAESGFPLETVLFHQPVRQHGKSSNGAFSLWDTALLGFTTQSRKPLRLFTAFGLLTAALSFVVAIVFLVFKLLNWSSLSIGLAPLIVGLFFFSGVQLVFLGVVGEYVGNIFMRVRNVPLVLEKERINFNR